MKQTESQERRILKWLKAGHRISPLLALRKFGSFRLGARIHMLKKRHPQIRGRLVNRGGKRFSEYWMAH